jgi:hypothetical protein
MTAGRTAKTHQNLLLYRFYLPGLGGCQPLLAVSFNQRVVGSIPTALTNKIKGLASKSTPEDPPVKRQSNRAAFR